LECSGTDPIAASEILRGERIKVRGTFEAMTREGNWLDVTT